MKERRDLVVGWFRKADSDLLALDGSILTGALDSACFHAQQAAEKFLKAFLISNGLNFPFTHNLVKLVELCSDSNHTFLSLIPVVEPLTPFAVELRYDADFWPSREDAEEARSAALEVRAFISRLLGIGPPTGEDSRIPTD